jgi:hypothetical protein
MLKPTSNYRMSSTLKTSLALSKFTSLEQRHAWKRACIDAELCSKIVPKREPRNDKRPQGTANYQTNDTGTASTAK